MPKRRNKTRGVGEQRSQRASDLDLMLSVERARGPNRAVDRHRRQSRWARELWSAYVLDGPGRIARPANDRPLESA